MIINWEYIIIHHSAGTDDNGLQFDNERDFHTLIKEWRDIGYHFINEMVEDNSINIVARPLTMKGAHCKGIMNVKAMGFCFLGNFEEKRGPSDRRIIEAVRRVIVPFMHINEIPIENVAPHRKYSKTACPGKYFRWDKLIAEIENGL